MVLVGLGVSFIGAFLFSYMKVAEIYDLKKKDDDKSRACEKELFIVPIESQNYVVYVIDPQTKK